jgi:4'-phosphopantetheinyl transferase
MITPDPLWAIPPTVPSLVHDVVHVWRVALDVSTAQVERLRRLLSSDESQRADRFHLARDRRRFIVARGLLRLILSRYLQLHPSTLQFAYTAFGKPFLAQGTEGELLNFNVSHSDELALIACTRGRAIGVDIESIRPTIEYEQIAARYFSPTEYAHLCTLPLELRVRAFFRCWTRKEAYIKAHGAGLSVPLDRFAVSLVPGEPARLLYTRSMIRRRPPAGPSRISSRLPVTRPPSRWPVTDGSSRAGIGSWSRRG